MTAALIVGGHYLLTTVDGSIYLAVWNGREYGIDTPSDGIFVVPEGIISSSHQLQAVLGAVKRAEQYAPDSPAARSRLLCALVAAQPATWLDPAEWPVPGASLLVCRNKHYFVATSDGERWFIMTAFNCEAFNIEPGDRWQPLPGRPEEVTG